MLKSDSQVKTWVLLGLIVRLASRLGYHRDSSHYSDITRFTKRCGSEAGTFCFRSIQLGLSSMINKLQSDTLPPHNLVDYDFSIQLTELPTLRPVMDRCFGSDYESLQSQTSLPGDSMRSRF